MSYPSSPSALTQADAVRFLQRTTFGGTPAAVDHLQSVGIDAWLDEQVAMTPSTSHFDRRIETGSQFATLIWTAYLGDEMQLRRRWAYALSQVFVVSRRDLNDLHVASYADILEEHCFGTYRNLLERVTRSPAMGDYLTYVRNRREDDRRGTVPDENYAREVMQLFSIGLWELNSDGTRRLDAAGEPIPAYGQDDILGLARVFTGFLNATSDDYHQGFDLPMDSSGEYAQRWHETGEKRFLGTVIPASDTRTLDESLEIALDTLAGHPNTAPFISHQLIQRMVTSNPSAAYVGRVAAVFADDGSGQRGNLEAVLRAIVLDDEAWQQSPPASFGKLREPVLRFSTMARALDVGSTPDDLPWNVSSYADAATELGQQPFESTSVFNFYRPGYVPPQSALGDAGLVAPEMQIANETTAIGWVNFAMRFLRRPAGRIVNRDTPDEYRLQIEVDLDDLIALIATKDVDDTAAGALVDEVAARLCPSGLQSSVRDVAVSTVRSIRDERYDPEATDTRRRDDVHLDRVIAAVMIIAVSSDFLYER